MPPLRRGVSANRDGDEEASDAEPASFDQSRVSDMEGGVVTNDEVRSQHASWLRAPRQLSERAAVCPAQMLEAFDTDKDGIVSKAEFERGMKLMRLRYADTLEINIDKLTTRLMFEDEKTTCGAAACLFFMFSALYIVVLTMQVRAPAASLKSLAELARAAQFDPANSYKVTKAR